MMDLIAADEAILPYRGGTDWFDGGKFLDTHRHSITPGNDLVGSSWNELTKNMKQVNKADLIGIFGSVQAQQALSEVSSDVSQVLSEQNG